MVERIDEIKHKVHEKNHRFRQRAIPPEGYTFMSRQMEGRRESTKARFILAKKNGWTKCKKLSFKFLLLGKFNTFCGLIDEAWRKVVGADVLLFGRLKRGPIRSVMGRLLRSV